MPPLPPFSGKKGTWEHQFDGRLHLLQGKQNKEEEKQREKITTK